MTDPFAPPTRCPMCGGSGTWAPALRVRQLPCKTCNGSGEFIRTGIFCDHSCSRCLDGARPERCPTKVRGNCGELRARND